MSQTSPFEEALTQLQPSDENDDQRAPDAPRVDLIWPKDETGANGQGEDA